MKNRGLNEKGYKLRCVNPGNKTGLTYVLSFPTRFVKKYKLAGQYYGFKISKNGNMILYQKVK